MGERNGRSRNFQRPVGERKGIDHQRYKEDKRPDICSRHEPEAECESRIAHKEQNNLMKTFLKVLDNIHWDHDLKVALITRGALEHDIIDDIEQQKQIGRAILYEVARRVVKSTWVQWRAFVQAIDETSVVDLQLTPDCAAFNHGCRTEEASLERVLQDICQQAKEKRNCGFQVGVGGREGIIYQQPKLQEGEDEGHDDSDISQQEESLRRVTDRSNTCGQDSVRVLEARFVLLQGPTGCGKTTYCINLVRKWGAHVDTAVDIFTRRFKLVLYLDIRHLNQGNLKDAITRSLPKRNREQTGINVIWQFLQDSPSECLIILDGLELIENLVSSDASEDIFDLLSDQLFYGCYVLGTGSNSVSEDLMSLFHKKVFHCGFSHKGANAYMEKRLKKLNLSPCKWEVFLKHNQSEMDWIIKRPFYCAILCDVLAAKCGVLPKCDVLPKSVVLAKEKSKNQLTLTGLFSSFERQRIYVSKPELLKKEKKKHDFPEKEMKNLYRLSLDSIKNNTVMFSENHLSQYGIGPTSITRAFMVKTERFVTSEDMYEELEECFALLDGSLRDYFAARRIFDLCPQDLWVTTNHIFAHHPHADICAFLCGLLHKRIPSICTLYIIQVLYSVQPDQTGYQCDSETCRQQMMNSFKAVKLLQRQCQKICMQEDDMNQSDESFVHASTNTDDDNETQIKTLWSDLNENICEECLSSQFHHVFQRFYMVAQLVRCCCQAPSGMKLLNSLCQKYTHPKQLVVGHTVSPYQFLIAVQRNDRLSIKIPCADSLNDFSQLLDWLKNQDVKIKRIAISIRHLLFASPKAYDGKEVEKTIQSDFRQLLSRLNPEVLKFTGVCPGEIAQIIPENIKLQKVYVRFDHESDGWEKLAKACNHISEVNCLFFDSCCSPSVDEILEVLLKGHPISEPKLGELCLRQRWVMSEHVFHRYVLHGKIPITLQALCDRRDPDQSLLKRVSLTGDPNTNSRVIEATLCVKRQKDLEDSDTSGSGTLPLSSLPPDWLLPVGYKVSILRIKGVGQENIDSLFHRLLQDGIRVGKLELNQLHADFILRKLQKNLTALCGHVDEVYISKGLYEANQIQDFLQEMSHCAVMMLSLQAATIDEVFVESVQVVKRIGAPINVYVTFVYNKYVCVLPRNCQLGILSYDQLQVQEQVTSQDIFNDLSGSRIDHFEWQPKNADSTLMEFLKSLSHPDTPGSHIAELIFRNSVFVSRDMDDMFNLASLCTLSLQDVTIGVPGVMIKQAKFSQDANQETSAWFECRYPQLFTDLFPENHQISTLTLKLYSEYNLSFSSVDFSQSDMDGRVNLDDAMLVSSPEGSQDHPKSPRYEDGCEDMSTSSDDSPKRVTRSISRCWKGLVDDAAIPQGFSRDLPSFKANASRGNSSHGHSSRSTLPDSANTLVREIAKGSVRELIFDLGNCDLETCDDLLQALVDNSRDLAKCVGVLKFRDLELQNTAPVWEEFMTCKLFELLEK